MQEKLTKKDMAFVSILLVNEWNHFLLAIWFFFYTKTLGLSATQASFLFTGSYLLRIILEIPTGIVADVKGRIFSYRIGLSLVALSIIPYFITKNFHFLLFTVPVMALGNALFSGCLFPIAHSYFEQKISNRKVREIKYNKYLSKQNYLGFSYRAIAGIIGAYTYSINNYIPAFLVLLSTIFSLYISSFVSNKKVEKHREKSLSIKIHTTQIKEILSKEKHFKYFFAILALTTLFSNTIWDLIQPYFKYNNFSYINIAIIFSLISLASAISSKKARVNSFKKTIIFYFCFNLTINLTFLFMPIKLGVITIIISGFSFGVFNVVVDNYIQKYSKNKYHSTLLSISSSIQALSYYLITQITGLVLDHYSISTSAQIMILSTSILPFIALFLLKKVKD